MAPSSMIHVQYKGLVLTTAAGAWLVRMSTRLSGLPGRRICNRSIPTATHTEARRMYNVTLTCITDIFNSFCVDNKGEDVQVVVDAAESSDGHSEHGEEGAGHSGLSEVEEDSHGSGCHFHAGVESVARSRAPPSPS